MSEDNILTPSGWIRGRLIHEHGKVVRIDGQPWGKVKPAPALPAEVIEHTAAKYREALERLMG